MVRRVMTFVRVTDFVSESGVRLARRFATSSSVNMKFVVGFPFLFVSIQLILHPPSQPREEGAPGGPVAHAVGAEGSARGLPVAHGIGSAEGVRAALDLLRGEALDRGAAVRGPRPLLDPPRGHSKGLSDALLLGKSVRVLVAGRAQHGAAGEVGHRRDILLRAVRLTLSSRAISA